MTPHPARRITHMNDGQLCEYVPFDPATWISVKVEIERSDRRFPLDQIKYDQMKDWLAKSGLNYRWDIAYEQLGHLTYANYFIALFPNDQADQAMLFRLTFG